MSASSAGHSCPSSANCHINRKRFSMLEICASVSLTDQPSLGEARSSCSRLTAESVLIASLRAAAISLWSSSLRLLIYRLLPFLGQYSGSVGGHRLVASSIDLAQLTVFCPLHTIALS